MEISGVTRTDPDHRRKINVVNKFITSSTHHHGQ